METPVRLAEAAARGHGGAKMRSATAAISLILAVTGAIAVSASRQPASVPTKASSKPPRITAIAAFPTELKLCVEREHQILVSAVLEDELEQDVSTQAQFKSDQPKIAEV